MKCRINQLLLDRLTEGNVYVELRVVNKQELQTKLASA